MAPDLKKYAAMAVPRYTSYPTVPHFSKDIGPIDYGSWLEQLDPADPVSLYLHVPFCRKLCWYCGCNMKLASRYDPVAAYVETLIAEIGLVARHLPGNLEISHLHWGGGTPTTLEPDDLERVMEAVAKLFEITPEAELAIEADPRTLSQEMIKRIGALGFTRASIGVQEFDPKVQAAINRVQPVEMVERAVDGLRTQGVQSINFDLIYGLPHQSVSSLQKTIDRCAAMTPDRLALFGYAHVPWMAKKQRLIDEAALPGQEERYAQAEAAAKALTKRGYKAIGLDHFALPNDALALAASQDRLRRNFQGYTTDKAETLIGLGASSIGKTPSGYVQNVTETGAWTRAVRSGVLPVAKGHAFQGDDHLRAHVIEQLMCGGSVDIPAVSHRFAANPDWFSSILPDLTALATSGLVRLDGGRLSLTSRGRPLVRLVASLFDSYFQANAARHSMAV